MNAKLEQVSCCLNEASRSVSAGLEQASAHLIQAGSILDVLISLHIAVIPAMAEKSVRAEAPRALAMTA
jgi:hypothetical protein